MRFARKPIRAPIANSFTRNTLIESMLSGITILLERTAGNIKKATKTLKPTFVCTGMGKLEKIGAQAKSPLILVKINTNTIMFFGDKSTSKSTLDILDSYGFENSTIY
jgi:hypothetical protein